VIHAGRRLSDRDRTQRKRLALGEAEKHFGPVTGTGLAKLCGRCERIGWVFERIDRGYIVVWEGQGHRPDRPDMSPLTDRDLVNPDFGCLYCHPFAAASASTPLRRPGGDDEEHHTI